MDDGDQAEHTDADTGDGDGDQAARTDADTDTSDADQAAPTENAVPAATVPRAPTIQDVARLAGVATSTVSRALSQPGRISAATRARVLAAAEELDYVPSSQARGLSTGRKGAVAVVVPDITNPFYFDLIRGTQHHLRARGITQLLIDTEESPVVEADALAALPASVDGIILAASRLPDDALTEMARRLPLVTINRTPPHVPTVIVDTPTGMRLAVEHLVALGHARIAYASGPDTSQTSALRWAAIAREATRHGIEAIKLGPFSPTRAGGTGAAEAVLNAGATGCIAFNDLLAIGMLGHLRSRGVAVPGDISIVGCDDIFGADFCDPPLTTLTSPIEQAGWSAVTLLISRMEGRSSLAASTPREVLATHLTVRESTTFAPTGDRA